MAWIDSPEAKQAIMRAAGGNGSVNGQPTAGYAQQNGFQTTPWINSGGASSAILAAAGPNGSINGQSAAAFANPQLAAQQAAEAKRAQEEAAAKQKQQQFITEQTGKINSMYTDTQAAQTEAIRRARDTATSGLGSFERTAIAQAYKNRNQVDAAAAQNALKLKEVMASNGLLSSGDNLTANIQQNNERLSALNNVNQAESSTLADISDRRGLIASNSASQEAEMLKQLSADKTRSMLEMERYQDTRGLQLDAQAYQKYRDSINDAYRDSQASIQNRLAEAAYTGLYNGSQTLQSRLGDRQDALARAGLTGTLDGQQTLQARGQQFQQGVTEAGLTGNYNGQQTLQARQYDIQNALANRNANWGAYKDHVAMTGNLGSGPKQDWGLFDSNGPLSFQGQQEQNRNNQWQDTFDRQGSQWQQGFDADQWYRKAQLSDSAAGRAQSAANSSASNALAREKFEYEKTQDQQPDKVTQSTLNSAITSLNKMFLDDMGKVSNVYGLRQAVISMNLPDQATDQILTYYGIPTGEIKSYSGGR